MLAGFEKISHPPISSFNVRRVMVDQRRNFASAFHYHPELELILTLTSRGKRFIGNHVDDYVAGELLLIGKNIPHCWLTSEPSHQIVIQMTEDFLGREFISSPECLPIKKLFEESAHGLIFNESIKHRVYDKILDIPDAPVFDRLLMLLDVLHNLAESKAYSYLSNDVYPTTENATEFKRMHTLLQYIHEHFADGVSLDHAAQLLNLSKSALCKFIKRKTKKTFSELVNEIRFGKATELLIQTDKTIYQVSYDSGFNDPSYFFKKFQQLTGKTPKHFRDSYR